METKKNNQSLFMKIKCKNFYQYLEQISNIFIKKNGLLIQLNQNRMYAKKK